MTTIRETYDLKVELIRTQIELEKVLEKIGIYDDQIALIKENSDSKYIYKRQLFRIQQQKLELEKRYKPKLDELKLKIKVLKEKIAKIEESVKAPVTTI